MTGERRCPAAGNKASQAAVPRPAEIKPAGPTGTVGSAAIAAALLFAKRR